jgi:hypothetical protein
MNERGQVLEADDAYGLLEQFVRDAQGNALLVQRLDGPRRSEHLRRARATSHFKRRELGARRGDASDLRTARSTS